MTSKINLPIFTYLGMLLLALCSGCGLYSFTGTTISPDIKSISIQSFENSAGEGPANLTQIVTNTFSDYYRRNTNLTVMQGQGDLQLEGQIVSFNYSPAAIQREGQQDIAGLNRLTLTVQVRFTNTKQPEKDFDQAFTISQDFPQTLDITQLSNVQIEQLTERLVIDVFNKTVADW